MEGKGHPLPQPTPYSEVIAVHEGNIIVNTYANTDIHKGIKEETITYR